MIPLTPSDNNVEIHAYNGLITGSVPSAGGGFNVYAPCHGGAVRVVIDSFTPNAKTGYWHLLVTIDDKHVVFNGKPQVGQMITGTGSRVRLASLFPVSSYHVEYHC